jgi:hydrogenase-4 membrane subunit HyfE
MKPGKVTIALIAGLLMVASLVGQEDIVGYVVDENGEALVGGIP